MPDKLTTNDVAKILGKASATILYYNRIGRLAAERTQGGMRLFNRADVERLGKELEKRAAAKGGSR